MFKRGLTFLHLLHSREVLKERNNTIIIFICKVHYYVDTYMYIVLTCGSHMQRETVKH